MREITFEFSVALAYMQAGVPVKRVNWLGYWILKDGVLYMHCKDGRIVTLQECDTVFTLENIAANDWTYVTAALRTELDKIHKSGVLVSSVPDGK